MVVHFEAAWCATDLGDHRPCKATYEWYPYDTLPGLDPMRFNGSFRWFGDLGDVTPEPVALDGMRQSLAAVGLSLPQDFVTFQTHSKLSYCLDEVSVTGCWSDLSQPMASPVEPGAYLIRFFRDQQDCVLWYLYLRPTGETFIVNSYELAYHLDYLEPEEGFDEDDEAPELDLEALTSEIFWCAPSFEEFAYRFWIENRLRLAVHNHRGELTPELQEYLAHYQPAAHR